jgi:hypothetical protein
MMVRNPVCTGCILLAPDHTKKPNLLAGERLPAQNPKKFSVINLISLLADHTIKKPNFFAGKSPPAQNPKFG